MTDQPAAAVRGKTIRLIWTEGPTKGLTHEHVFHQDGTVEWRDVATKGSPPKPQQAPRPLTLILNFKEGRTVGFASGAKEWYPVQGTFEVVK